MLNKQFWLVLSGLTLASVIACGDDDDGGDVATGGSAGAGGAGDSGSAGVSAGEGGGGAGGGSPGSAGASGAPSGGVGNAGGRGPEEGGSGGEGGMRGGDGGTPGSGGNPGTGGSLGGTGGSLGGTGGTVSGGAGNAGANPAGGDAGSSGAGGAGGGGPTCGPGLGLSLKSQPGLSQNGWIDGSTNCVGVQGSVNATFDTKGSNMTFSSTLGHICVSGIARQVLNDDFTSHWGAVLSIELNNPVTPPAAMPYDATAYGVQGFAFRLESAGVDGLPDRVRTRYRVDGVGAEYCEELCSDGEHTALFRRSHTQCWLGTSGATPNTSALTYLEIHVPGNISGDVRFDFCVEDLRAMVTPTVPNPPTGCGTGGGEGGAGGTSGAGGWAGGSAGAGGGTPSDFSCVSRCDIPPGDLDNGCFCDADCVGNGDCCADYGAVCR